MIRHMFKMIWNRKRRNSLLIIEILFSFLVLFGIVSAAISGIVNYNKPLGFDYENVWILHAGFHHHFISDGEGDLRETFLRLQRELDSFNEIEHVSWSSVNVPYGSSTIRTSLEWQGQDLALDLFAASDDYAEVFRMPMIEGRWFTREDDASSITPVVVNRELKEMLFGEESAVGKTFASEKKEYMVVGVIDAFRYHGEFAASRLIYFIRTVLSDTLTQMPDVAVLRVREGTDVGFEKELVDHLSSLAPGMSLRIENIKDSRVQYIKDMLLSLMLVIIIAGFLIFNVALGLFGVLWYSINRRRAEVGLRRAVGANAMQVSGQILGETLVLATFAIIAGIFLASQVPLLGLGAVLTSTDSSFGSITGIIYILGMAGAAIMIYLLVSICALYPSRMAARIYPAQALHDE